MANEHPAEPQRTNRLASETSPYLLQHARNPVDWYPWGPEALERAEREDKPILLSVGYSACHWCHVMERECFENPTIAALMNASFVCIKVDREERPDIDDVYMAATIAITGAGGWPMTVFCTPEQTPFFAGTYFPPEDRQGRPGFATLLQRIARLWDEDRDALYRQGGELRDHLLRQSTLEAAQSVSAQSLELATGYLARGFDAKWGGFGTAPKFPPAMALHLLMRQFSRTGNSQLLEMVTRTLDSMARGGMYDHVGGGFARYSTDERWLVPHFEKMLYDNAQLARVYLHAHRLTGNAEYAAVVRETLDYVLREMHAPDGGYYSAQDADSEGEEGKYFVFTPRELRGVLEPEEVRLFCAYYDITDAGNWEGMSIPNTPRALLEVASELGLSVDEAQALLRTAKAKVLEYRQERVAPDTDDKVLTGWNGLMIGAMSEAARVFAEEVYLHSATRAAEYIWSTLRTQDGKLLRTTRKGHPHVAAVLEDYAYLADALVDLYEATAETAWLTRAHELAETLLTDFLDSDTGTFFQTSHHHEALIVRVRGSNDGALPDAGTAAARALLRLSRHLDEPRLAEAAVTYVRAHGNRLARKPHAYLSTLLLVDDLLTPDVQLLFNGPNTETPALRRAAAQVYLPNATVSHAAENTASRWKNTPTSAGPALYICRSYTCQAPVTEASDVALALRDALRHTYSERAPYVALPAIPGHATATATLDYLTRHGVAPTSIRKLGLQFPVSVSRIGFGMQRVLETVDDHQAALRLALTSGCNVIDTAHVYGSGSSERAAGSVLAELQRKNALRREEVVLITKVTLGVPEMNIDRQLDESLARMNIATVDVCLLHNPESLLEKHSKEEALRLIGEGFASLEQAAKAGKVVRYGVSSHVLATPNAPISIVELKQAATAAGAARFEIVQVPLNPVEADASQPGWLQLLTNLNLQMLTHRALDTVKDGAVQRLFDAPTDPASPSFGSAVDAVASLEHEFRAQLGAVLAAVPDVELKPQQLLTWSERIGAAQIQSREQWNEFERGPLAKELTGVINALDRAFAGKQLGQLWRSFRERYTDAMEVLILASRQVASEATNRRNRDIRETLLETAPSYLSNPSLAQLAVHYSSTQPLVVCTLVGMRMPEFARELTEVLRLG